MGPSPPSAIIRRQTASNNNKAYNHPTTTSRRMAASIAEGPVDYRSTAAGADSSAAGWHHRVLKVFRRKRRGQRLASSVAATADQVEALNLMGRPFDLPHEQHLQTQTLALTLDLPPMFGSQVDPFPVSLAEVELATTSIGTPSRLANAPLSAIQVVEVTPASTSFESRVDADLTRTMAILDATTTTQELPVVLDTPQIVDATTALVAEPITTTTAAIADGGSPFVRITRPWVQSILEGLLDRWSQGSHVNMMVHCSPQSKALDLVQGRFACDASVDFDRIVFGPIRMHRGRIEVHRMTLGIWSLTPSAISILRGGQHHRYLNQFEFMGRNVTFTQADLIDSRCIRNGLKNLLARILKLRGTKAVRISIETIEILPNGKVACRAAAKTGFGKILEFEVRSGLDVSSRGHVLTFPGLEISLSPALGIFVPVLPAISLDLGHNAQLLDVHIDGQAAEMTVSARVTIAPHHTLKLRKYKQSQDAYLAQYSVDVGRWLTRLGNFTS